jgi:hypothetical protein
MAIFFRSCSFAAERLISGLILAIYALCGYVPAPIRSEVLLASPKKSPAYGGEPKTPRIRAFLAKPFRTAF